MSRHRHFLSRRHHGAPAAPVLIASALILALWGAWDAFATGALYFRGQRGTGIVIHRDDATDDTRLRVGEAECPVYGDQGPIGRPVPVVYPHGRPRECIVRRPQAFKWSAGALLFGGALIAVVLWRRAEPTKETGPA